MQANSWSAGVGNILSKHRNIDSFKRAQGQNGVRLKALV